MNTAARLHEAIVTAGVTIVGVSIGKLGESSTVRVHPEELQERAQPVIDSFDWSEEASIAWETVVNTSAVPPLLMSADSIPQAIRVICRVLQDHANEQWRRTVAILQLLGAKPDAIMPEPLLEDDFNRKIMEAMQAGLSLPGPRKDTNKEV